MTSTAPRTQAVSDADRRLVQDHQMEPRDQDAAFARLAPGYPAPEQKREAD